MGFFVIMAYLREQAGRVQRGSLADAEAMLMNQATALQSLFARLAERGMSCDNVPGFDANMRMAGAISVPGDAGNAGGDQESSYDYR